MFDGRAIAHVAEDGRVHGLEEHLRETARRSGEYGMLWMRSKGEWLR